jgi:phosphoribosylaminoimidazole (AIR) synthetase
MADYTITLTDAEVKAFESVTVDVDAWLTNAGQNRARIAKEIILSKLILHCNDNGIAIATGETAQIQQAYDLNIVDKASSTPPPTP